MKALKILTLILSFLISGNAFAETSEVSQHRSFKYRDKLAMLVTLRTKVDNRILQSQGLFGSYSLTSAHTTSLATAEKVALQKAAELTLDYAKKEAEATCREDYNGFLRSENGHLNRSNFTYASYQARDVAAGVNRVYAINSQLDVECIYSVSDLIKK